MKPNQSHKRRSRWSPRSEQLESRQVLSAGAGNTIAIMPEKIEAADQPAVLQFQLDPANFQAPRGGQILLGIDVVPTSSSQVKPVVSKVETSAGKAVPTSTYRMSKPIKINGQTLTPAVVARLALAARGRVQPAAQTPRSFKVTVQGANKATGEFLAGYYLIGDVDGNGRVERKDLDLVRKAMNAKATDTNYVFDADSNRDGQVTRTDLMLAQRNLGARTSILPLITADLDPASDSGSADRITSIQTVKLSGVASAGATVVYTELANRIPEVSTVADETGKYQISIKLAEGTNQFQVKSTDSFGQTIQGTIAAITYKP